MKQLMASLTVLLMAGSPAAQQGARIDDIDRTASACADFDDFANGKWGAPRTPCPLSRRRGRGAQ